MQEAWIDEQTPLCGFCQNGMMIKATELLEQPLADHRHKSKTRSLNPVLRRISAAAVLTRRLLKPFNAPPALWRGAVTGSRARMTTSKR